MSWLNNKIDSSLSGISKRVKALEDMQRVVAPKQEADKKATKEMVKEVIKERLGELFGDDDGIVGKCRTITRSSGEGTGIEWYGGTDSKIVLLIKKIFGEEHKSFFRDFEDFKDFVKHEEFLRDVVKRIREVQVGSK